MAYLTQQKLVLRGVIDRAERPLTPGEICAMAQKEVPTLGIATVYRALRQFVEEGMVNVVEIPGASPHYESAGRKHHHFFLCESCKRLFDLVGCVSGMQGLKPKGFEVSRHEIVLYGACKDCLAAA